jgi:hypothetical protein
MNNQELDALSYLQAVYQGKIIAEPPRMRAAIEALPFERPRLAVTANVDGKDIGKGLERAMRERGLSPFLDALPKPDEAP